MKHLLCILVMAVLPAVSLAHSPIPQNPILSKVIYVAKGSSADYYYWKLGERSLGIEIRQDGSPSFIPRMIKENRESTWRFIESFH